MLNKNYPLMEEAVSKGADVNACDPWWFFYGSSFRTPLHYACANHFGLPWVEFLIEHNADPTISGCWPGTTPLDYARQSGSADNLKLIQRAMGFVDLPLPGQQSKEGAALLLSEDPNDGL